MPKRIREEPKQTSSAEQPTQIEAAAEVISSTRADVETWAEMRERHGREEAANLHRYLEAADWYQLRTANALGISVGSLQARIAKYPELQAELRKRVHPQGKPAKRPDRKAKKN